MRTFDTIGIIGRQGSAKVLDTIRRLKVWLLERQHQVILDDSIADMLPGHGVRVCPRNQMGEHCDLVIVVGGDGSILGAARALAPWHTPVLGINRGTLGFLTDISPEHLEEQVAAVLAGYYSEEERFLLECEVVRDDSVLARADALNDVVLHPGKSTRMIAFDLYIDDHFVYSLKADGLIIATPTGSTAYALSAGGPIMHPQLEALVIVPMYPHTLSSRPIVVGADSQLKIIVSDQMDIYPLVSCDGQNHASCAPGDIVHIRRKACRLHLLHPEGHNFYTVCRDKLGWERR